MKWNVLSRKIHYWVTVFLAIPVLIIASTGLLLQVKKHWSWVQPTEQRGTGFTPGVDLESMLLSVQQIKDLNVAGWQDVNRLEVRPSRGLVKVWLRSGWEAQLDLATGQVLQTAYRRSDLIESIHDGSFFAGEYTKLGIFFPAGFFLLIMWVTGLWMFWLPFSVKRKRKSEIRTTLVL